MQYTKKDAIRIVTSCAETYQNELNNRNLLFLCLDKHKKVSYIEVAFHKYSYMHLTGLSPNTMQNSNDHETRELLSADMFFDLCLKH
ncbi:MAG: PBECR4 domain-containing protein, partial [Lachnospiraceae bacterium]|nr:PBECR4 domain-containing protein [Lachnospiraceae bacterium]